jgi:hypothetical protein
VTDRSSAGNPSAVAIRGGLRLADWSARDLWVAAVGIGGGFEARDVERIAAGEQLATPMEHDVLAAAFNDHFIEGGRHLPVLTWTELHARG